MELEIRLSRLKGKRILETGTARCFTNSELFNLKTYETIGLKMLVCLNVSIYPDCLLGPHHCYIILVQYDTESSENVKFY